MDLSCFLLIANICLPPGSTQVTVTDNTIARQATASYSDASLTITESRDNFVEYDWPADATLQGSAIRYWKYSDTANHTLEYLISDGATFRNLRLTIKGEGGDALLGKIRVVSGQSATELSKLSTLRAAPTPQRKRSPRR